jgi:hypothetical protein
MKISFRQVNPKFDDPRLDKELAAALKILGASDTAVAKRTLRAITSGRVKVDGLNDFTRKDFRHVAKDLHLRLQDYARLHDGRTHAAKAIARDMEGWAWDDRVYVAGGIGARRLASRLVHEVTHVLNRSEEHYRGAKQILLEEYRSFYAEKLFAGVEMTPARAKRLKAYVISLYELKGVTPADVPDVPPDRKAT